MVYSFVHCTRKIWVSTWFWYDHGPREEEGEHLILKWEQRMGLCGGRRRKPSRPSKGRSLVVSITWRDSFPFPNFASLLVINIGGGDLEMHSAILCTFLFRCKSHWVQWNLQIIGLPTNFFHLLEYYLTCVFDFSKQS